MAQFAHETSVAQEQRFPMTYEEFLASELSESHAEWVDGEVIIFMPPNTRHAHLVRFLSFLFGEYVEARALGELFFAPYEMRLAHSSREPDILFVAEAHLGRLDGQRLNGPADLVVEVISDDSVERDRAHKYREYEEAGIPEYLLIDPRERTERITLYRLDAHRIYQPVSLDAKGRLPFNTLPGFWLDLTWLRREPLPRVRDVLAQIAPEHFSGPSHIYR